MNNYSALGEQLRYLRLKNNVRLTKVAEVINVDKTFLSKIEKGTRRPSKEVLEALGAYFSLEPQESLKLFLLAGYINTQTRNESLSETSDGKEVNIMHNQNTQIQGKQAVNVKVPDGLQVLYTDSAFITARPFGLTFDFGQTLGPTDQHTVVARVGLSVEHAKEFIKLLSKKIVEAERMQAVRATEEKSKSADN